MLFLYLKVLETISTQHPELREDPVFAEAVAAAERVLHIAIVRADQLVNMPKEESVR